MDDAASPLQQVMVYDMTDGTTKVVSASNTGEQVGGYGAAVSADGRYMVFSSGAMSLFQNNVAGWPELFLRGPLD
jgi:hypothetical protein